MLYKQWLHQIVRVSITFPDRISEEISSYRGNMKQIIGNSIKITIVRLLCDIFYPDHIFLLLDAEI